MAIAYKYPPNGETTPREPWQWVAVYKDGSTLTQFDLQPKGVAIFHRFDEIDRDKLAMIELRHDQHAPVRVPIPEGAKPIHFYRNTSLENDGLQLRYYVIGYEQDKQRHLIMVTDRNNIYLINDSHTVIPEYIDDTVVERLQSIS